MKETNNRRLEKNKKTTAATGVSFDFPQQMKVKAQITALNRAEVKERLQDCW